MKTAVVITNGSIKDYNAATQICKDKFVICADGAITHCMKMSIIPDVWVGDKDSCTLDADEFSYATTRSEIILLNPQKDMTDTEYACDFAAQRGFDDIVILGALGTRFDHTIAKIYLLKRLFDKGIKSKIIDDHNIIYIADRRNKISKGDFDYVSLVPLDSILTGVSNNGLKYKLSNEPLVKYSSRGISNELVSDVSSIDISDGDALIILSKD